MSVKLIYIWVHRKYLWSIEARSNFSHFNGKTWISHQNSDKGLQCELFFCICSISLSYLHFFENFFYSFCWFLSELLMISLRLFDDFLETFFENCELFFCICSISLLYLHFFADIDFIQQEQKYFYFCVVRDKSLF